MKKLVDVVDATPSKRLFLSIIADYDLNRAICELIDNALDIWVRNGRAAALSINIILDTNQQHISVIDDAGGVSESELSFVVGPGHTGTIDTDETIGIFGVGTKRAVVALAQDISIRTRQKDKTFLIEFDDDWIRESEEWELPVYEVDSIPQRTTHIQMYRLRKTITDEASSQLIDHLGATYSRFLSDDRVDIQIDGQSIEPITFYDWAYPPKYEPREYHGEIPTQDGCLVKVRALAGLTTESSPAGGEYGVYVYCNDRLIARALKTYDVGFTSGMAGKPHADISLARVILSLHGEARLMPWNSSKSDIDPSHEVFIALRQWLLHVVKDYTSLARRFSKYEGGWPENVFKYRDGEIHDVEIPSFPEVNTSYLPPLPRSKPRFASVVKQANKAVAKSKPWTIGLFESLIAVDWILKQSFEQRNRIVLILLDSTLEIAFKEYLVHESGARYSNQRLQRMFPDRTQVHQEVKKYAKISNPDWGKIGHFYDLRCQLIHQRASAAVSDRQIQDYRSVVERVLRKLFKLKFA